jgi:hypothetical protein
MTMEKSGGWCAPMGRAGYVLAGMILMMAEKWIDDLTGGLAPRRELWPSDYIQGLHLSLDPDQAPCIWVMLAVDIPFILIGCWLILRRLRDLRGSPYWTVLFFAPGFNMLLYLALCVIPGGRTGREEEWIRWLPGSKLGAALLSVATVTPVGILAAFFLIEGVENREWGVLVGIPFAQGFISVQLAALHRPVGWDAALLLATLCMVIMGVVIMFVCPVGGHLLAMILLPIFLIPMAVGALLGAAMQGFICRVESPHI